MPEVSNLWHACQKWYAYTFFLLSGPNVTFSRKWTKLSDITLAKMLCVYEDYSRASGCSLRDIAYRQINSIAQNVETFKSVIFPF